MSKASIVEKNINSTQLTILIKRKERYFQQIQNIFDLTKSVKDVESTELFLIRIAEIDGLRTLFEKCIFNIFECEIQENPDALLSNHELQAFDELYFRIKLFASKLTPSHSESKKEGCSFESRPRLPKLELFCFDGDIENFTTFYETFCSLVHNQPHIPKIDKFHYLLSCTKGSALNIVKSVPISANNYDLVWQSLLDKYHDNRLLVGRYLDRMLNFIPLTKESSSNLNQFIETFEHSYKAIKALNIENLDSYILCHIALRSLDHQSRQHFEQSLNQNSIPKFSELMSFIHNQIKVLDHSSFYNKSDTKSNYVPKKTNFTTERSVRKHISHSSTSVSNNNKRHCLNCGGNHMIYRCDQFRKLTSKQRVGRANQLKLCHNCLKQTHKTNECKSEFKCFICGKSHNTLLHVEIQAGFERTTAAISMPSATCTEPSAVISNGTATHTIASSLHTYNYSAVILATAVVYVKDRFNYYQPCRVLIDSGAQSNFISITCLQRLGLATRKCNYNIFGLAGECVKTYGMTSCTIKPRHSDNPIFNIDAVVLNKITCDLPTVQIPQHIVAKYRDLLLADPNFHKTSPIDIILASDVFPFIYDGKKIILNADAPVALGSVFGFVITGKLSLQLPSDVRDVDTSSATSLVSYTSEKNQLNDTLKRFWEVEAEPCSVSNSPLEEIAEKIYVEEHFRDETGRYISPILLNPNRKPLGESYHAALKRFISLERKLARSPDLRKAYGEFMSEYESLGHMEVYKGMEPSQYFIPHHYVLRPSSTSTPLRVVFDGSSPTSNGVSLNDNLLTGQKLQHDIFKIIMRFRLYDVCFTADISKMYRQVHIKQSDRKYQHILWRESPSEPLKVYELKTNTYGLRSAPYIAIRTLHQLAYDNPNCPASKVLMEGFFVDDLLWSCETTAQAYILQDELMTLLKSGGFDLRKWSSNTPELLNRMQSDLITQINFKDDTLSSLKVLGLTWLPSCDSFSYNYSMTDVLSTKRSVLKLLASIYDPVGFISPCTFLAKCIMQDLWKLGLGWDEHLPTHLQNKWDKFLRELSHLAELRIDRHILINNFSNVQLVGFCDASSYGYAACLYFRSEDENGNVKSKLLASKTKVAPLHPVLTIPRLELMAALLLSKLIHFIAKNLTDFVYSVFAFSDSSVVLSWLQTPPYKLKTFVSSRISQIIDIVPPSCWFHISSENNAADICSRGALPSQLVGLGTQWVNGPEWLKDCPDDWPKTIYYLKDHTEILESKQNVDIFNFNTSTAQPDNNQLELIFNKFSSFNKLQRTISWCYRFTNNIKSKLKHTEKLNGPLRSYELKVAHDIIVKIIQHNHFWSEIKTLTQKGYVSSFRKLSPFIDANDFLRVGGRLSLSELPYDTKHPLLLPKKCHITNLLIEYYHKLYLHVGPRTLQGILSKKYWIVNARSIIRSVLSKCIQCFKCRPSVVQPVMGTLPAPRLMVNKVFNHVGCDLGGPFIVKENLRRNAKKYKTYLCLFVCFSTKAVHLEVLTDLSCDCFLAAFDRFVARRGLCSCLYTDCGSNFIAAAKHLKEVYKFFEQKQTQDDLLNGLTSRLVEWKKNPPNAPSMGGLWEAGIKSAKYHLSRSIGDCVLTLEELITVFCKIEAIMNSRPLCALSDSPNEFDTLTAGHFLIGRSLLAVPEYEVEDVPLNRLSRWQSIQKVSQTFWKRWSNDYLHTLQQREKWCTTTPNIKVGDLVLLKSNLSRPLQWPRGRIEAVHPGADNVVRVVTVRTRNGLFKRPVNKICPFPNANQV